MTKVTLETQKSTSFPIVPDKKTSCTPLRQGTLKEEDIHRLPKFTVNLTETTPKETEAKKLDCKG